MPQITFKPGTKGLVQETGSVVAGEDASLSALATMSGNGETISTAGRLISRVDAGGLARTGVIMEDGTVDGQICIVINVGGETLTMDTAGTSNVAAGTAAVIGALSAAIFVYDSTTAAWHALLDT